MVLNGPQIASRFGGTNPKRWRRLGDLWYLSLTKSFFAQMRVFRSYDPAPSILHHREAAWVVDSKGDGGSIARENCCYFPQFAWVHDMNCIQHR